MLIPADFQHQDIVKQDIVTVTVETNIRQGEAVVKEQVVTLTATIDREELSGRVISRPRWTARRVMSPRRRRRATRHCQSGRRVGLLIFDRNGCCSLLAKAPDDVSTYVLSVEDRFVGNGFQLALCNVGWLATRESVVLAPDPIVSAPWSVLFGPGGPCVTAVKTRHTKPQACFLSQASEEWPVTGNALHLCTESVGRKW